MHQEAPDKLVAIQGHNLQLVVPVVFIAELNLIFVDADNTLIGDGNAMSITGEISDHAVGSIDTRLAIHDPIFLHQLIQHAIDFIAVGDTLELTFICTGAKRTDQVATIVTGQCPDREQVIAFGWMPPLAFTECTTWYQAMLMHMLAQVLPPGVQYRRHPQLAMQAFSIRTEGLEGFPNCLEQQVINNVRV